MSLTKFASFEVSEVLDIKSAPSKVKTASLRTLSDFHDYRTDDGYLYVRIRAISSRVNKNNDGWPTAELAGGSEAWERISSQHQAAEGFTLEASSDDEYGYSTFIGKPIFVDHNNSNPDRARGVIVDSKFNVLDQKTASEDSYWGQFKEGASKPDVDMEHFPASEVELLLEVDAEQFPKFAKAITEGELDGFSMGCDVDYSKCSHCGNKASSPDEYCSHIVMKGATHTIESGDHAGKTSKSYENCYGIRFFEISGVFDPADETALTKEVRASVHKEAGDPPYYDPNVEDIEGHARKIMADNPGMTLEEAMPYAQSELMNRYDIHPSEVKGGDGYNVEEPKRWQYDSLPGKFPMPNTPDIGPVADRQIEGAPEGFSDAANEALNERYPTRKNLVRNDHINSSYLASRRQADNPEPQSMKTKAPEDVNTLREEQQCPLCGSDMDASKCDVCGYEEPPEQLQNPDLSQAHDVDLTQQEDSELTIPAEDDVPPADGEKGESYLKTRNSPTTASVKSEMRWAPKGIDTTKTAAAPRPQGDEPNETVTSDQTTPVTSAFRTATELIASAAAKRNQEKNNMSDQTKVAADPADASGKPDKRVDVEGVGGVIDSTNEQASKPEGKHGEPGVTVDVEGKGGVLQDSNAEASKPDEKVDVAKEVRTDDSGPTKTWDNSNEPNSAVTDKAYPTAAKKGTDPIDPSGKPDERVDVEAEVPHDKVAPGTDQWTGTDGNGVTKQVNPVTNTPTQSGGIKSSLVSLAALRLADTEVELGLTTKDEKYNRLAELAELDEAEIAAEQRALAKVKTASLTRTASKSRGLPSGRMPSFNKVASDETPAPQPVDDALLDNALFTR